MREKVEESGFTRRVFLGIIYSALVLTPGSMWISLTGGGVGGQTTYATIFFISELAFLTGKPLKRQEIFVLLSVSGVASTFFWDEMIFWMYFTRNPFVASYIGAQNIPTWWTPPSGSVVWTHRTFFHSDMLLPVAVTTYSSVTGLIAALSLALALEQIYLKQERLPFPMQQVTAQICDSLSEKGTERYRIFIVFCFVGFLYSFFLYFFPSVFTALLGVPVSIIPLPWIDLTSYMEKILPGASFGISPSLTTFMLSFILPPNVILSQVIGSFAIYMVCNPLLVSQNIYTEWVPGLSLTTIWTRSTLYFWAPVSLGLSVGVGVLPLVFRLRGFTKSIKPKSYSSLNVEGKILEKRLFLPLLIFLFCSITSTAVGMLLAPEFPPIIFPFFTIVWPLVMVIYNVRAIGVTGVGMDVPYIREGVIYLTGYSKYDIWFTPLPTMGAWAGASGWITQFKVCELTSTIRRSLIISNLTATFIAWITGFIVMSFLWGLSPIPSALFPVPGWDRAVVVQTQFISGQMKRYNPLWITGGFLMAIMLYSLQSFTPFKISPIGFAAGVATAIPIAFTMFLGLTLRSFIIKRIKDGEELFSQYRTVIVAGAITGEGVIASLGIALAILLKGVWPYPY